MGRKFDFKYLVIGSGPAGSAAALAFARAKKKVGLIEGGPFGGANLNTRDVPYSVTLDFAHTYYQATRLPEFGYQDLSISYPSIAAHQMKAIIESGGGTSAKAYEDAGLICIKGYANFLDDHTVAVGERKFSSEYFILATGAALNPAGISGTDRVEYLTPDTALGIRRLPQAVLVIGGGSTGCEIAEYYAALGAKTLIIEQAERLLPREDPAASQIITDHFTDDLGITVLTSSRAVALTEDQVSKYVVFHQEHNEKMVRVDTIVLATGSKPNLNYGIDNTGVRTDRNGFIKTNRYFETTTKHIYAIGDCASAESSTERAYYEGRLLARNLINKSKVTPNYRGIARITNTFPAIAAFDPITDTNKPSKHKYKQSIVQLRDVPAGKIFGTRAGFVKILADHTGHIVGGCIVANQAPLMASELSLAIRHHLTTLELASTPHLINQPSYALQMAAKKLVK